MTTENQGREPRDVPADYYPSEALVRAAREIARLAAEYELDPALDHRLGEVAAPVFDDKATYGAPFIDLPFLTGYSGWRLRGAAAMYRAVPDRGEFRALLARRGPGGERPTLGRLLEAARLHSPDSGPTLAELALRRESPPDEPRDADDRADAEWDSEEDGGGRLLASVMATEGCTEELADEIDKYVSAIICGQCAGPDGAGLAGELRAGLDHLAARVASASRKLGAQEAALRAGSAPQG